jgi:hypothetical protein
MVICSTDKDNNCQIYLLRKKRHICQEKVRHLWFRPPPPLIPGLLAMIVPPGVGGGGGGLARKHNRTTEPGLNEPKQFRCARNFPMHSVIIESIQQLALYV